VQGRLTGWSKGSRQMEHFGTVEVSGSALLERLDALAAVVRLRRLGMLVDRRRNRQRALILAACSRSHCIHRTSRTLPQINDRGVATTWHRGREPLGTCCGLRASVARAAGLNFESEKKKKKRIHRPLICTS
jgi:hypothetical protein